MAAQRALKDQITAPSQPGGVARTAAGVIAAAAVTGMALQYTDFVLGKDFWAVVWSTVDFFSKFTIEINLLVALVTGAVALGRGDVMSRPALTGGTCLYSLISGVTYALLLRDVYHPEGLILVAIILLHYAVPTAFAVYWLLFVPKGELRPIHIAAWLVFPSAYVAYSLARGAVIAWYPYPFLDVAAVGYPAVLQTVALMILGFSLVAVLLIAIDRLMGRFTGGLAVASLARPRPAVASP
jgi:hypothetical protein